MNLTNLIVTTSHKALPAEIEQATKIAAALGIPFWSRAGHSLEKLKARSHSAPAQTAVLCVTNKGLIVHTPAGQFFFHPGLAELRIKNLNDGKDDHMVSAMALEPGLRVLDCTLGLGTDAIVASFAVGPDGLVVGLEASPVISLVVADGLASYDTGNPDLNAAMRRITVKNAAHTEFLLSLPAKSFDIVYFDPMFRRPVFKSSGINPLRMFADSREIAAATVEQAKRIARRKVVMKEANGSGEFQRLGFSQVLGGKYSSVSYGIIDV